MKEKIKKILIICLVTITLMITITGLIIEGSYNNNIPVLAYHNVENKVKEDTNIEIEKFRKQMKWLKDHHYKSLSLDEFYAWKHNKKSIKGRKVVITFDDGKDGFYQNALPILEKYNLKSTVFVIQSRVDTKGYLTKEQILDLKKNHPNVGLESHSYQLHNHEDARSNDYDIYNQDMKKNKGYRYYAYPFGITNKAYQQALKDNGYKASFRFSPSKWVNKKDDDYNLTRVPVYNSTSFIKFILKVILNIK